MKDNPYYRLLVYPDYSKAFIAEMQDFDEFDYDGYQRITQQKFETPDDAQQFINKALNHPNVPEHVKEILRPLQVLDFNIDDLMVEIPF